MDGYKKLCENLLGIVFDLTLATGPVDIGTEQRLAIENAAVVIDKLVKELSDEKSRSRELSLKLELAMSERNVAIEGLHRYASCNACKHFVPSEARCTYQNGCSWEWREA